jgi:hypothetical protein
VTKTRQAVREAQPASDARGRDSAARTGGRDPQPGTAATGFALLPYGSERLVIPAELVAGTTAPPLLGPLPPGTTVQDGAMTVTQTDPQHAEIRYGDSWVRISSYPGDVYTYSVGPPIEGPPRHDQELFLPGAAGSVLLSSISSPFVDDEVKPELPQRLVRVASTRGVVDQHIEDARVAPLAVQTRITSAADIAQQVGILDNVDVDEYVEGSRTSLRLERTMVVIEPAANAAAVVGDPSRARYAYSIDPEWTGADAAEKGVVVVAGPGVVVRSGEPENPYGYPYGRRLVPSIVRVPHPDLVPEQGTRLSLDDFVSVDVIDPDEPKRTLAGIPGAEPADQHSSKVHVGTGLAGVSIDHPWSGARVTVRPVDPEVGAAYAWQVVPPENGLVGEIRLVVGPGVLVDLAEPIPHRLRDPTGGPTPTPRKGEARFGEGLEEELFELELVEVYDPALVPVQGTPLNIEHFLMTGNRSRAPDTHEWIGANDLPFMVSAALADTIISFIPIVGELYMIGEFAYTAATGHDWWGNDVDDAGKVMMGVGAAISLIPLVGGLTRLMRGAAEAARIAQLAERLGTTTEELQATLVRVGATVHGDEAAAVSRATRAITHGEEIAEADAPVLQRVLGKVGAGELELGNIARTGMGRLDLSLAAAGERLQTEEYLANLVYVYRTTGDIPESLVGSLARSGHFANAEEAGAAVQQALRDLAHAEGVVADEGLIAEVAARAGKATERAQASAAVRVAAPARRLAVRQPELVAEYERLVDERLPQIMDDVLQRQGATPTRTRLAQLRGQFDQLRAQVGPGQRLTTAQRDLANDILREARQLAEDDWGNVRNAVWRRLRNARQNPDLAAIEAQLRAEGDVGGTGRGALRLRMATEGPGGTTIESFQEMNLEHRVRRSDNPWLYNDRQNLILSDVAQNQQYLESLRRHGSIWPTGDIEEFVVRHALNDQGLSFAPATR